jgi:death-on-curing protein
MRFLTLAQVLRLHDAILDRTGGAAGIRDLGRLESALAQPRASFGGTDLHPSLLEKAAALCFALVQGHPFIDGNKRIGHAVMEVFLVLNGQHIVAPVDEQESVILSLASGELTREQLLDWLQQRTEPHEGGSA